MWWGCVFSMNGQLEQLEEENNILSRWKPHDKEYEEMRTELLKEKILQVRTALWSSVIKGHYLLRMKAKYAYAGTKQYFITCEVFTCMCIILY